MKIDIPVDSGMAFSRVLLVEDDAIISINTEMMLCDLGVIEVESAASVAEAMALVDEADFDLGILDFSLGDETSVPVVQRLCSASIPVVITTGFQDLDLPEDCKPVTILHKPYRLAELGRVLEGLRP